MMFTCMEAKPLQTATAMTFEDAIIDWETSTTQYERITGRTLDDELKRAVLLKYSPQEIRSHLQINAERYPQYAEMKNAVVTFLKTSKVWIPPPVGGPMPMDIGGVDGKGGGKGLKGGDRQCSCCGRKGHMKNDCKLKDVECRNCKKTGHIAKVCRAPGGGAHQKGGGKGKPQPQQQQQQQQQRQRSQSQSRMSSVTCYNCQDKGHLAKDCPKPRRQGIGAVETAAEVPQSATQTTPKKANVEGAILDADDEWVLGVMDAEDFQNENRDIHEGFQNENCDIHEGFQNENGDIHEGFQNENGDIHEGFQNEDGDIHEGFQNENGDISEGFQSENCDIYEHEELICGICINPAEWIMVDSGACTSVCRRRGFPNTRLSKEGAKSLRTILGNNMHVYGTKIPRVQLESGRKCQMNFQVSDAARNALGVSDGVDRGFTYVFSPQGSYLTAEPLPQHIDENLRDDFHRHTGLFLLKAIEIDDGEAQPTIAPVVEQQPGTPKAIFDGGEIVVLEKEDPSEWLPDEKQQVQEKRLAIPIKPEQLEVDLHELTHCPPAQWCEDCTVGKSRGSYHLSIPKAEQVKNLIQFDYTFWSHRGVPGADEKESAGMSITGIDTRTGLGVATMKPRKGPWDYFTHLFTKLLDQLGYQKVFLRGDAEGALLSLLRSLVAAMPGRAELESSNPGSHQSIGNAENGHQKLGGQVRVLVNVIKRHTGLVVEPKSRLFAWLVRHAQFILNRHLKHKDGSTSWHAATGRGSTIPLAQFGEAVHFKVNEPLDQGKSAPRWLKGIWVGISEISETHVILDENGAHMARNVKRLIRENQWDAELIQKVCGLPWNRTEGTQGGRTAVKSVQKVPSLPMPELPRITDGTATPGPAFNASPATPGVAAPSDTFLDQAMPDEDDLFGSEEDVGPIGRVIPRTPEGGDTEMQPVTPSGATIVPQMPTIPTSSGSASNQPLELPARKRTRFDGPPDGDGSGDTIASMFDYSSTLMTEDNRYILRMAEIDKLDEFGTFLVKKASDIEEKATNFTYVWVDTADKSRICMRDSKAFGKPRELTHCPTPTTVTNNAMDARAIVKGYGMICFDVVSAFPHSGEMTDGIYMWPPDEWRAKFEREVWEDKHPGFTLEDVPVWQMVKSLYGRRTAGANFRDYFEESVKLKDGYVRGDKEPCLFYNSSEDNAVTHHIDDGRMCGPDHSMNDLVSHLAGHMLLKVTGIMKPGMAVSHLRRTKVMTHDARITIPAEKHAENIFRILGYNENPPTKYIATPGIKRGVLTETEESELEGQRIIDYRSATGSMIYLSSDRDDIMFATKELARRLQKPLMIDWLALTRAAKYIWFHRDIVLVCKQEGSERVGANLEGEMRCRLGRKR